MIAENIKNIRENVAKACFRIGRDPQSVELIAVSKTFGPDKVLEGFLAGQTDFGENYVQELIEKRNALITNPIRWHFIGHLQSNKVKYIAEWIHLIHSVDSEGLAAEIDKRAQKSSRVIDVLIEVNTSEEATKFGVKPEKAIDLMRYVDGLHHVNLKGLMTIGPFTDNKDESRTSFKVLKNIFDTANSQRILRQPMTILSMGMTHDFEIAIEEGSTMIRIGTAIFGLRTKQ
ncbi:MAG: YggS family pyridoxal phosphate-dependent enzyme [Bacteroidota bacterium]